MEMVSECINARFKFKARMQVRQNRRMASYRVVKLTPAKTGHLDRRGPPPRRLFYRLPSGIGLFQPLLLRSVIGDVRLSAGSGVPGEGETNDRAIATPQTNQGTGGSRSATLLSGAACGERTAVLALRRSRTWSTSQPSTSAFYEWGAHEHPSLMSPDHGTPGNGLLLFFRVDDFDLALQRARSPKR